MELKVKAVEGPGTKSVQEVEEQLLEENKAQEETQEQEVKEEVVEEQPVEQKEETPEFGEQDVLSFIKDRYNKEINSVEELFAQKEENDPLPEDVSTFLKYKKETGQNPDAKGRTKITARVHQRMSS